MNYFQKGNEYFYKNEYIKAILNYKEAIYNNQNVASSNYNLGICLIKLKRYEDAILYLKNALNLNKKSQYFFNYAYVNLKTSNYKKALIYFNRCWAMDPENVYCREIIDYLLNNYKKDPNNIK